MGSSSASGATSPRARLATPARELFLRPIWRTIQSPARTTCAKSTPECTPSPSSMYTTSSVATLPEAPGPAKGQPPSPPTEESMVATPRSSAQ